ncbi:MAG: diaminopimelate epimerase, partial [Acidobacteria bacterium]|nr:diaminopimelate epimerase [Acidobacteriota bacterium]
LDRSSQVGADFEARLFNADGGESPISGNGTRCLAAYLYLFEKWDQPQVAIATGAGIKILKPVEKSENRFVFQTEMGMARLKSSEIPLNLEAPLERVVGQTLEVDGRRIQFTATSMGNPHCSIFVDDFNGIDWRALGARIETHPAFPERTNVEFIRPVDRERIEVRFWERGCGETMASGTGACGAALAAILNGMTARKVEVITAGGRLQVEWREDGTIVQTGEARAVFKGEWYE